MDCGKLGENVDITGIFCPPGECRISTFSPQEETGVCGKIGDFLHINRFGVEKADNFTATAAEFSSTFSSEARSRREQRAKAWSAGEAQGGGRRPRMGSPERRDLEPRREQAQRDTTEVAESRGSASGRVQGQRPCRVRAAPGKLTVFSTNVPQERGPHFSGKPYSYVVPLTAQCGGCCPLFFRKKADGKKRRGRAWKAFRVVSYSPEIPWCFRPPPVGRPGRRYRPGRGSVVAELGGGWLLMLGFLNSDWWVPI